MIRRECAVVPTSGMRSYGDDYKPDLDGLLRASTASRLYHDSVVKKLLVTGGNPGEPKLADVLAEDLVLRYEVPEDSVLKESESLWTDENARFSAQIFEEEGLEKEIYLVTNDFHKERAESSFRNHGFDVEVVSAEYYLASVSEDYLDFAVRHLESERVNHQWIHEQALRFLYGIPVVGPRLLGGLAHWRRS